MAASSRWNYWVEINAGSRDWVDFNGNQLDRIIFSKMIGAFSASELPNTLILPIVDELSSIDEEIESFPTNTLPKIPDFSFSLNAGYDVDGITYSDILVTLENANANYGKTFNLSGCRINVVCGNAAKSGMWHNGTGWKTAFGDITSSASAPSTAEDMTVIYCGIVSNVDRSDVDQVTIETSYPQESATVGTQIVTDDEDSIRLIVYAGDNPKQIKAELKGGVIQLERTPYEANLYYCAQASETPILVDAESYQLISDGGLSYDSCIIDLRRGTSTIGTVNTGLSSGNEFFTPSQSPSMLDDDRNIRFCSVENDQEFYPNELEQCGFAKGLIAPTGGYYPKIQGRIIPQTKISGRGMNGSSRLTPINDKTLTFYENSSDGEKSYAILLKMSDVPYFAYADDVPDEFLISAGTGVNYVNGTLGGNGDLQSFIDKSKLSSPTADYTWSVATGRYAPVSVYGNFKATGDTPSTYIPNMRRLVVPIKAFSDIPGTIEYCKISIVGRYRAHVRPGHTVYLTMRTNNADGYFIKVLTSRYNSTAGNETHMYGGDSLFTAFEYSNDLGIGRQNATTLSEIYFDCCFDTYEDTTFENNYGSVFGSFHLFALKVEAKVRVYAKDGDTFIYESYHDEFNNSQLVASDLCQRFCPSETVSGVSVTGREIAVGIGTQESIRDSLRDIYSTGGVLPIANPSGSDNTNVIPFVLRETSSMFSDLPISFSNSDLLIDDLPLASTQSARLSDIYNAFRVRFGYDAAKGKYTKIAYVDKDGYQYVNCTGLYNDAVDKCIAATAIIGQIKNLKSIDLRFATESAALLILEEMANYFAFPAKSGTITVPVHSSFGITLLRRVSFTGDKFPLDLSSREWYTTSISRNVEDGEAVIGLKEIPKWGNDYIKTELGEYVLTEASEKTILE